MLSLILRCPFHTIIYISYCPHISPCYFVAVGGSIPSVFVGHPQLIPTLKRPPHDHSSSAFTRGRSHCLISCIMRDCDTSSMNAMFSMVTCRRSDLLMRRASCVARLGHLYLGSFVETLRGCRGSLMRFCTCCSTL